MLFENIVPNSYIDSITYTSTIKINNEKNENLRLVVIDRLVFLYHSQDEIANQEKEVIVNNVTSYFSIDNEVTQGLKGQQPGILCLDFKADPEAYLMLIKSESGTKKWKEYANYQFDNVSTKNIIVEIDPEQKIVYINEYYIREIDIMYKRIISNKFKIEISFYCNYLEQKFKSEIDAKKQGFKKLEIYTRFIKEMVLIYYLGKLTKPLEIYCRSPDSSLKQLYKTMQTKKKKHDEFDLENFQDFTDVDEKVKIEPVGEKAEPMANNNELEQDNETLSRLVLIPKCNNKDILKMRPPPISDKIVFLTTDFVEFNAQNIEDVYQSTRFLETEYYYYKHFDLRNELPGEIKNTLTESDFQSKDIFQLNCGDDESFKGKKKKKVIDHGTKTEIIGSNELRDYQIKTTKEFEEYVTTVYSKKVDPYFIYRIKEHFYSSVIFPNFKQDYEGELNSKGQIHGEGRLYFNDFSQLFFHGEFKFGEINGHGTFYYPNYNILYEGNLQNNQFTGNGTKYHVLGFKIYEGEYLLGCQNGKGKFYYEYSEQPQFDGNFFHNHPQGPVKYYDIDGSLIYDGTLIMSRVTGSGKFYQNIDNKSKLIYDGDFSKGRFEGDGSLHDLATGLPILQGEFENNAIISGIEYLIEGEDNRIVFNGKFDTNYRRDGYESQVLNDFGEYDQCNYKHGVRCKI